MKGNKGHIGLAINIVLMIITFLSLIMNILLLHILLKKSKIKSLNLTEQLIVIISIFDIAQGFMDTIFATYHAIYGKDLLYDNPLYCQLSGWLVTSLLLISLVLLVLVSYYRLILFKYNKTPKLQGTFIIMTCSSLLILSTGIYCFISFEFKPVGTGAYCYPSLKAGWGGLIFYIVIALMNILIPIFFGLCYLGIFVNYRKRVKEVEKLNYDNDQWVIKGSNKTNFISSVCLKETQIQVPGDVSKRLSNKLLFRIVVYIFFYLPCWIPNLVAIMWDLTHLDELHRPPILDGVAVIGVLLTMLMNPVMVFLIHSPILNSLLYIFKIKKHI